MLAHEFMRNAFLAGTFVALACGLVGYFVVLRGQVFAGDALSHVAFTGALAAAAAGVDIRLGLFVATIGVAVGMAGLGQRARPDDVVIGSVFAWVLGLGVLFLSLFVNGASGSDGTAAVRVLFGSILGLSAAEARLAALVAIVAAVALLTIARPLLFTSLDPDVARGLGMPVRLLGLGFLVILAAVAAEATQAVGALLLLGLLAAPGGAARLLTDNPWRGLALSAAIAVASTWAGLVLSYEIDSLPAGSAVIGVATGFFLFAAVARTDLRAVRRIGG
ncbi:MAG: zinc/manganese transport system permease protein [Solirubrobacterales bacterium]|jgi:zinc/manganese transport system permease protein|nr:zinc/manganese transport system permease protein [Solirubrobacterales bacterium]